MLPPKRVAALFAAVAAVAFGTSACTPDTTRARVEHDVPLSFAHPYALSEQLQGHQAVTPKVTSTECHSSTNTKVDSGPGSWGCDLTYTVGGKTKKVSLLVLVVSFGFFFNDTATTEIYTIVDKATGATLPDPKVGFDGC